jgi:glutaredoxin
MNHNIIWTTNYCPFCDKAKGLLDKANIEYETRLVDEVQWTKADLLTLAPNATTYPQIFLNDNHIGGSDELEAYLFLEETSFDDL